MGGSPATKTPQSILRRIRDPRDDPAWSEFYAFCDPLFRRFCLQSRLDSETSDEICREAWDRLWQRMQTFQYDPGKRFRHWLWIFFRRQILDFYRSRRREHKSRVELNLESESELLPVWLDRRCGDDLEDGDEAPSSERARSLMVTAGIVQERIKAQIKASTWQAYWLTAIDEMDYKTAGEILGMSAIATFKAARRVKDKLEAEGRRILRETESERSDR